MTRKSDLLMEGYRRMHAHFGHRRWWPGETPFEVMVGAILTQNTNWTNVEKAIVNLKRDGLLSVRAMYALPPAELAALIRPAGFFRLKTGRLRAFLKFFIDDYAGDAARMADVATEALREKLLHVKGIGPETADSILLYALGKPIFVIDAYTKRILNRHRLCIEDATYEELQELFMDSLPREAALFNDYHAQLVEVGKRFCKRAAPKCEGCPLNGWNW
jgi:endonuclease III related protein